MIHQDRVEQYPGDLAALAEDVGNLKYDALAEFLRLLSAKIDGDAAKDQARGRVRLAAALRSAAGRIGSAEVPVEHAWKISKPFMSGDPVLPPPSAREQLQAYSEGDGHRGFRLKNGAYFEGYFTVDAEEDIIHFVSGGPMGGWETEFRIDDIDLDSLVSPLPPAA
jgi:hypothetical protein